MPNRPSLPPGAFRAEGVAFLDWRPMSFAAGAGECVAIFGESGSGKTLLLRALADLDPHAGEVWLGDAEQQSMPAPQWRRQVGFLPAEAPWWEDAVGSHFGDPPGSDLLARLGFDNDVLGWESARLSAGERQRLGLARLLCQNPRALLLDEPTANLDAGSAAKVEAILADYARREQVPVVWVSHDPAQRARVAGRAFRLAGKALEEVGA